MLNKIKIIKKVNSSLDNKFKKKPAVTFVFLLKKSNFFFNTILNFTKVLNSFSKTLIQSAFKDVQRFFLFINFFFKNAIYLFFKVINLSLLNDIIPLFSFKKKTKFFFNKFNFFFINFNKKKIKSIKKNLKKKLKKKNNYFFF